MPRDWDSFDRFGSLVYGNHWKFAKTMAYNPHHYTLRRTWENDADFAWAVEYMRADGYPAVYGGRDYIQLDVNDHFYWEMGDPVEDTVLINRKVRRNPHPYDSVADKYDAFFNDNASAVENLEVMDMVGRLGQCKVLDVGCGTGLLLRYETPRYYLGIDPSHAMVEKALHHSPNILCTPLSSFFTRRKFDVITLLFGVASYLSEDEVRRLKRFLAPGGRIFAMFYQDGYTPVTYKILSGEAPANHGETYTDLLSGRKTYFSRYAVVEATA